MRYTVCPSCKEVYEVEPELVGQAVRCGRCGSGLQVGVSTPCAPGSTTLIKFSLPSVNLFAAGCETLARNLVAAFAAAGEPLIVDSLSDFLYNLPSNLPVECGSYAYAVLAAPRQTEAVRWYFYTEMAAIDPTVRAMLIGAVLGVWRGAELDWR